MDADKRNSDRRFQGPTAGTSDDGTQKVKIKKFLRNKATTYTAEMIKSRREWLAELTQTQLKHLAHFSEDPEDFKENRMFPIGVAHVPVGLLGPFELMARRPTFLCYDRPLRAPSLYTFGSNIVARARESTLILKYLKSIRIL